MNNDNTNVQESENAYLLLCMALVSSQCERFVTPVANVCCYAVPVVLISTPLSGRG